MRNDVNQNEQEVSSNTNLSYVFQESVAHYLRLIATNGTCSDTTTTFGINVLILLQKLIYL